LMKDAQPQTRQEEGRADDFHITSGEC